MEFLDPAIENYAQKHSSSESELLSSLNRNTHAKVLQPRMLSGHLQGRVLSMLSFSKSPKYILEIGTYTGYSALCLSEGLVANGELHTIDNNEELREFAEDYFARSINGTQIKMHTGNALDIIPTLDYKWDMVFIDADKENYLNYYNLVIDKMNSNGLIIADNVLWSGKVAKETQKNDLETKGIKEYNKAIQKDKRVDNVLMPIRDGLMIARVI